MTLVVCDWQSRDILDTIDSSSQPTEDLMNMIAGHKDTRQRQDVEHPGDTGAVDSLWAKSEADQRRSSSPVWHFNFTTTPEFVLQPVNISCTPSPRFS